MEAGDYPAWIGEKFTTLSGNSNLHNYLILIYKYNKCVSVISNKTVLLYRFLPPTQPSPTGEGAQRQGLSPLGETEKGVLKI